MSKKREVCNFLVTIQLKNIAEILRELKKMGRE